MSPGGNDFRWLTLLRDRLGKRFIAGFVLHAGRNPVPFGDRLAALPLSTLWLAERSPPQSLRERESYSSYATNCFVITV